MSKIGWLNIVICKVLHSQRKHSWNENWKLRGECWEEFAQATTKPSSLQDRSSIFCPPEDWRDFLLSCQILICSSEGNIASFPMSKHSHDYYSFQLILIHSVTSWLVGKGSKSWEMEMESWHIRGGIGKECCNQELWWLGKCANN